MSPQDLSGGFFQAVNTLFARELLAVEVVNLDVLLRHIVGDEDLSAGDSGTSVTTGDFRSPKDFGTTFRELVQNPCFTPDVVSFGAHPLRPVVSTGHEAGAA
jgi:hypothetical protein